MAAAATTPAQYYQGSPEPLLSSTRATTSKPRIEYIDMLRGTIMLAMAWDHMKDTFARHELTDGSWFLWSGPYGTFQDNDLAFLMRFVSHFCAPGFFYTMGMGMILFTISRTQRGWSPTSISYYFLKRGLVLLMLSRLTSAFFTLSMVISLLKGIPVHDGRHDLTTVGEAVVFALVGMFDVLTCLGLNMMLTGLLLPVIVRVYQSSIDFQGRLKVHVGLLLMTISGFALSNACLIRWQDGDPSAVTPWPRAEAPASSFGGVLLRVFLVPGALPIGHNIYPIIPWCGITWFGCSVAFFLKLPAYRHLTLGLGLTLIFTFIFLRSFGGVVGNLRGPPRGEVVPGPVTWLISYFNVEKYPPSPTYACITLGVCNLLMWLYSQVVVLRDVAQTPTPTAYQALNNATVMESGGADSAASTLPTASARSPFLTKALTALIEILIVYGQAPLFFYVVHVGIISCGDCFRVLVEWDRVGFAGVFAYWSILIVSLYFLCGAYGKFRKGKPADSLWHML